MNMEPMSWRHLILNNPEWVGVLANAIFAVTTISVVVWQVFVMKAQTRIMALQVRVMRWQGHVSARHERIQNRLIHLQHEHEWMLRLNAEREQILKLARKLHLAAGCLTSTPSQGDGLNWREVEDTGYELNARLRILDVDTYTGEHDNWYLNLTAYLGAILEAVTDSGDAEIPSDSTRGALKDANDRYNPISIFLDLESAIRLEFFDFKNKWDAALPS